MAVMDFVVPYTLEAPPRPRRPATVVRPRLPDWKGPKRAVFRYVCAYLVLFCVPQLLGALPGVSILASWYESGLQAVAVWLGAHVLRLDAPIVVAPTGSGDTMAQWVVNGIVLALALILGTVWNVIGKRREYRQLHRELRVLVRFTLAAVLLGYGFAKVIPNQFPHATLERLGESVGEMSPMGLLWTFMGYSVAYNVFTGLGEVIGSLLLCFRRTATLGALLLVAVMSNVVILNFAYDVPVKLYSINLLLMALFVAAPDLTRLFDLLIRRQSAAPEPLTPLFRSRRMERGGVVLRSLVVLYLVAMNVVANVQRHAAATPPAAVERLLGIYDIQTLTKNGRSVPLLVTDRALWRRVTIGRADRVTIRTMGDSVIRLGATIDSTRSTLRLTPQTGGRETPFTLAYRRSGTDRLVLAGRIGADSIVAHLVRVDESKLLLVSRGFHLVQEQPFNR